jgi:hypothetical protein
MLYKGLSRRSNNEILLYGQTVYTYAAILKVVQAKRQRRVGRFLYIAGRESSLRYTNYRKTHKLY